MKDKFIKFNGKMYKIIEFNVLSTYILLKVLTKEELVALHSLQHENYAEKSYFYGDSIGVFKQSTINNISDSEMTFSLSFLIYNNLPKSELNQYFSDEDLDCMESIKALEKFKLW